MANLRRRIAVLLNIFLGLLALTATARAQDHPAPKLRPFHTPYYDLYTDLDDDGARETWIRMTKMFEEYKRRTAGFSGDLHDRFPFFLYKNPEDYYAAGGLESSAGVFMQLGRSGKLMAIAGENPTAMTWHVIQHEGFHQFAAAVIRGELPPWINEGLAEYFGEAVFTGDGFVAGVIPPNRLKRIQHSIELDQFRTIRQMMALGHDQWNNEMDIANYDEAWSMVHFLAHGEDGKYQKAFVAFMNQIGRGAQYMDAWNNVFGNDAAGFQKKWMQWWLNLPTNPTRTLYVKAEVMTLTSFFARAYAQDQKFTEFPAFLAAAAAKELKMNRDDWLPPALLATAVKAAPLAGEYVIETEKGHLPRIVCTSRDGSILTASFTLAQGKVAGVTCDIKPPPTTTAPDKPTADAAPK